MELKYGKVDRWIAATIVTFNSLPDVLPAADWFKLICFRRDQRQNSTVRCADTVVAAWHSVAQERRILLDSIGHEDCIFQPRRL